MMLRLAFALCCALLVPCAAATAAPRVKVVKFAVSNPTDAPRADEQIVISIADIKRVAPDFSAGAIVVTSTKAATLEEDARTMQAAETPSQVDDLDGDNQPDEIAFTLDLAPRETRIVTIAYGEQATLQRVRSYYTPRTHAAFHRKYEGIGWESELTAWRLYFDQRNAIDLYGKKRPGLYLETFAAPAYDYHAESPLGRDIYKNGDALGLGSVGAIVGDKVLKVGDVRERSHRVVAQGPVRAIVELTYKGWQVGDKRIDLVSRITQWANDRGFTHEITARGDANGIQFVTGLPDKLDAATRPELSAVTLDRNDPTPARYLATYGRQVLQTGASASESLADENLGLAIIVLPREPKNFGVRQMEGNHIVPIELESNAARWYVTAAWDREGTERIRDIGNQRTRIGDLSEVLPPNGITSQAQFLAYVRGQGERFARRAQVKLLSTAAAPQSAPPDTLRFAKPKTYREAIELMRAAADRTAAKWEPILDGNVKIEIAPGNTNNNYQQQFSDAGFFTEGNDQTGEWKSQKGYFWTGSFWVGELWRLHARTKNEKYRRWAEKWNAKLLGEEMTQNHDVGFLYFYSSVFAYEQTRDEKYKQSALRAAERLKQLYNPATQLIAAWEIGGDDSIIDSMMNLQLLYWAAKETKNPEWLEMARAHALRSGELFVRDDGAVFQSVHYNPGDDRQYVNIWGTKRPIPNSARPGEVIFKHTHQGFAADTSWSRGAAWALYGFPLAYKETKDPRLLATANKIAAFVLDHLPEDGVPWYDFYDEGVHFRNRDTSAATLIAGGLLELSELDTDAARRATYRREGERIIQSIINRYLTPVAADDRTPVGVLRHGSSTRPFDGMTIYGDYYLLESLLWLDARGAQGGTR